MTALLRNNVKIQGSAEGRSMLFAHGYGCDQGMWRHVAPAFQHDYRTVLFDHVGAGQSDHTAYSTTRYAPLQGYAEDIVQIGRELGMENAVFVGHSVSAMMGILAAAQAPGMFSHLILVAPSPCYINDGDYVGGFSGEDISELLVSLEQNHIGWSRAIAPVIMGNPDRAELAGELEESFCRIHPDIASHFARTTFCSDERGALESVVVPSLILQCTADVIAPLSVGSYMHARMPGSTLVVMRATGHCPNLSAPEETIFAIRSYLS